MSEGDRPETQDSSAVAREALRESLSLSSTELAMVRLFREQNEHLAHMLAEHATIVAEATRQAITDGIADAVQNEALAKQFFTAGIQVLKEQAYVNTGRFVIDSLAGWFKRHFWGIVFLFAFVYFLGWAALKHAGADLWHAITTK